MYVSHDSKKWSRAAFSASHRAAAGSLVTKVRMRLAPPFWGLLGNTRSLSSNVAAAAPTTSRRSCDPAYRSEVRRAAAMNS